MTVSIWSRITLKECIFSIGLVVCHHRSGLLPIQIYSLLPRYGETPAQAGTIICRLPITCIQGGHVMSLYLNNGMCTEVLWISFWSGVLRSRWTFHLVDVIICESLRGLPCCCALCFFENLEYQCTQQLEEEICSWVSEWHYFPLVYIMETCMETALSLSII